MQTGQQAFLEFVNKSRVLGMADEMNLSGDEKVSDRIYCYYPELSWFVSIATG